MDAKRPICTAGAVPMESGLPGATRRLRQRHSFSGKCFALRSNQKPSSLYVLNTLNAHNASNETVAMPAKSEIPPVSAILRERMLAVLGRLSANSVVEALKASSEVEMLSVIAAAAAGRRPAEVEAIVAERLAAARFKERLATEAGGLLNARQVLRVSKLTTTQAVYKAAGERRLLAVETDNGPRYPAIQFQGELRSALPRVLKAAPNTPGWSILQYLFARHEGLAGERPIDLLNGDERAVERAERFARTLED